MQYKVFGCKVNKYYTDKWLNSNYLRDKSGIFIASCVVTDSAKRKWVRFVKKAAEDIHGDQKIFISGCGAFKDGKAQINFFELYPDLAFAKEKIEILDEAPPEEEEKISINGLLGTSAENTGNHAFTKPHSPIPPPQGGKGSKIDLSKLSALKNTQIFTRKYVLIQGGCDSFCSFCLTVQKRGRHFYRDKEDIASEIEEFYQNGGKEAVLTGVNLAAWGLENTYKLENFSSDIIKNGKCGENKSRLAELLHYILEYTHIPRLRISSLGPEFMTDEVLEVLAETRIIPHFHYSIQSGSSTTLASMRRHYDGEYMRKLLTETKNIPRKDGVDISIGADIIVGFPGECDEDFQKTYELVEKYHITKLHAFPFSAHTLGESVPAGKFADQVAESVKQERMQKLLVLGDKNARAFALSQIGKKLHVLVEKYNKSQGSFSGWSENYLEATEKNFRIISGKLGKNEIISGYFV